VTYQLAEFNAMVIYDITTNEIRGWVVDYPTSDDPSFDLPGYDYIDIPIDQYNLYASGQGNTDLYTYLCSLVATDNPLSSGGG